MDHIRKVVVTKISISLGERIAKSQHKRYYFLFNKTVKTIISDYISHETVTFDDRDPPWINKFYRNNKFEWTLHHIRIENIISAPVWVTIFFFFFFFFF